MKQEKAAGKVLLELIGYEIIDEKYREIVWMYLLGLYAAGFDDGRKVRSNKRAVIQCKLDGTAIEIFESAAEASRRTGVDHADICKVASGKTNEKGWKSHTAGGFKWKYVNIKKDGENNDSSDSE